MDWWWRAYLQWIIKELCSHSPDSVSSSLTMERERFLHLEGHVLLAIQAAVHTAFRIELCRDTDVMDVDADCTSSDHLMDGCEAPLHQLNFEMYSRAPPH